MGSNESKNGIVKRNEDHRKKAVSALLLDGECFYTLYPSRSNSNQLPDQIGHFENLQQYCGFCFNRKSNVDGLVPTVEGEGMFDWSIYIKYLESTNIRGAKTLIDKQLTVVGYYFELCYDLCLSPSHNVSNNSGFESILGVFNNSKSV